mmetsp:Transcript_20663/g.70931  ORF Transcript_20663/g.70931 Transcript_20663/m.70931 type:complete len:320 (-) Transcript_20663:235-1194(-)
MSFGISPWPFPRTSSKALGNAGADKRLGFRLRATKESSTTPAPVANDHGTELASSVDGAPSSKSPSSFRSATSFLCSTNSTNSISMFRDACLRGRSRCSKSSRLKMLWPSHLVRTIPFFSLGSRAACKPGCTLCTLTRFRATSCSSSTPSGSAGEKSMRTTTSSYFGPRQAGAREESLSPRFESCRGKSCSSSGCGCSSLPQFVRQTVRSALSRSSRLRNSRPEERCTPSASSGWMAAWRIWRTAPLDVAKSSASTSSSFTQRSSGPRRGDSGSAAFADFEARRSTRPLSARPRCAVESSASASSAGSGGETGRGRGAT